MFQVCALEEPYLYNIPLGVVLLNVRNLKEIRYHPELHQIEDQVGNVVLIIEKTNYFILLPIQANNIPNLSRLPKFPNFISSVYQVLACEAVKNGQRVFVCNSFVLLDSNWNAPP